MTIVSRLTLRSAPMRPFLGRFSHADAPCPDATTLEKRRWGLVRTSTETLIRARRDRLVALLLDYERWPTLFPATIVAVELVRAESFATTVMVTHRKEGRVPNVLRRCASDVVELMERKPRYDAVFVNRFEEIAGGTRYRVDAWVRMRGAYALLAPVLRGVVERAVRRYTMEPLRTAAERGHRNDE
jgi:hypothetical protein